MNKPMPYLIGIKSTTNHSAPKNTDFPTIFGSRSGLRSPAISEKKSFSPKKGVPGIPSYASIVARDENGNKWD